MLRITRESSVLPETVEKTCGHFPFAYAPLGLMALAAATFPVYALIAKAQSILWWGWVLIAVFLGPALLLWLYVARLSWHGVLSGFRRTNWVAKFAADGVWLKFRSHLNWNAPEREHEPTVVFVPYALILQARLVREHVFIRVRNTRRVRRLAYLELQLDKTADTTPLHRAVLAEIAWKPEKRGLGKFDEVPLYVAAPGVLRVTRVPGLLAAMAQKTPLGEKAFFEYNSEGPRERTSTQTCVLDMLLRGDKMGAYALAQFDLGVTYAEAKDMVDALLVSEIKTARR